MRIRLSPVRIVSSLVACLFLSGLVTASVGAEEPTKPGSFDGTVVSYTPGVATGTRVRRVGAPPTSTASGLATPGPDPSPTPSTPAKRHSFYGTVTSFSPPADGKPGSISAQAQSPSQAGVQTFVVTDQTQFHDSSAPQIGDWVGIVPQGTTSDDLLALVIYVRPAGSPTTAATESPVATATRSSSTPTPSPDGSSGPDASSTAPTPDDAAAGMLVAYVAVIDGEDGVIEIRLRRPTEASMHVESFLIPSGAEVDVASTDGAVAAGDPVAITWELRDGQRVALSVAIG